MIGEILSADSHVLEPHDLWATRMQSKFRGRAPYLIHEFDGATGDFICCPPLRPISATEFTGAGVPPSEMEALARGGYAACRPGAWDPAERLKDMDLDGVAAEVFYCGYGLFIFNHPDDAFQRDAHRVYNDWAAEYASYAPSRLIPIANISMTDPAEDLQELTRARKAGFKGILISNDPRRDRRYHRPMWEPFWTAVEEYGLVVNIHILTGQASPRRSAPRRWLREQALRRHQQLHAALGRFRPPGARRQDHSLDGSLPLAVVVHVQAFRTIAEMITSGLLERHPALKIVSVENDIGWIPHHLKALDWYSYRYAARYPEMKMPAGDYWRRQVYATFQDDEPGIRCRDMIGLGHLMWGSDYPHPDSTFPNSRTAIARNFAAVPEDEQRLILHDNLARLYDLRDV